MVVSIALFAQQCFELLRWNPNPVVRNHDNRCIGFHPSGQDNGADLAFLFQDSMEKGILNNRLEDQCRDLDLQKTVRYIHHKINSIAEPHVLKAHVDSGVFKFIFHGCNCIFTAQRQLVEPRQIADRSRCFSGLSLLYFPADHIHCVIKKMRIDLRLQGIEFGDSQLFGRLCLLGDQPVDLPDHIVVGIHQLADLIH